MRFLLFTYYSSFKDILVTIWTKLTAILNTVFIGICGGGNHLGVCGVETMSDCERLSCTRYHRTRRRTRSNAWECFATSKTQQNKRTTSTSKSKFSFFRFRAASSSDTCVYFYQKSFHKCSKFYFSCVCVCVCARAFTLLAKHEPTSAFIFPWRSDTYLCKYL